MESQASGAAAQRGPRQVSRQADGSTAYSRRWVALGLLCLAQLMLVLDVTVVNVALPDIGTSLSLGRPTLTWILTAYTMAFGGLMLLGGRLADTFGARRVMLAGLVIFTAASAVSGLARTAPMLIGGRAAQGIGAALLSPAALAMVSTMFSGTERNRALGLWAAIGGAGAALGVILGGVLTSAAGWPWVFFINLPIGLAVLIAVPMLVPAAPGLRDRGPVDVPGGLVVTAATGSAIYGLISAGSHGWLAGQTLLPLAIAVTLYAAFALIERTRRAPLMDVRILRRRAVATGTFLMLVATGLLVGLFFLGSFYLQRVRGFSALATGLAFLPVAAAAITGAQGASHAVAVVNRRVLMPVALAVAALGLVVAAAWHGPVPLILGMSVAALGIGAILVAATTTALADVAPHEAGLRSGILNTSHELGSALGVAVLSTVAAASLATAGTTSGSTATGGFTRAFIVGAVAALAGALVAAVAAPGGTAAAGASPHGH
ncbi:MAG TPA: MFS transporter [Streptosporangiaceae bacterium]|nr:MFS transporter [Streptosporangiaceae bacterium]